MSYDSWLRCKTVGKANPRDAVAWWNKLTPDERRAAFARFQGVSVNSISDEAYRACYRTFNMLSQEWQTYVTSVYANTH